MAWQFDSDRPIYAQLVEQIQRLILSGAYPPGSKLPSVRELAAQAAVNPNTMQRALSDLEREGLVYSQRTAGRVITEDQTMIETVKTELAQKLASDFLTNMAKIGYQPEEVIALLSKSKGEIS